MVSHQEMQQQATSRMSRIATAVTKVLVPVMRWLLKYTPWLSSRLDGTFAARLGRTFKMIDDKRFSEGYQLAIDAVRDCDGRTGAFITEIYWWSFVRNAVRCATELTDSERQQVMAFVRSASEPGGVIEAECRDTFSRWRWRAGDKDGAIELARGAVRADPTWLYAHVTLAWYGLITGRFDPLPSLRNAVRADPELLKTIADHTDFAKRPELMAALRFVAGRLDQRPSA